MQATIRFKYLGCEKKTSSKGNSYYNIAVLQGADVEKLYYPQEAFIAPKDFTECLGNIEIKKDKFGTHVTLLQIKEVK